MGYKIIINIFFAVFIVFFCSYNFVAALEVQYPTLSTGANITSNTPLPEYLKYVFDFGMFLGFFIVFLTFVFAGVLYLLSPAVPNAKAIAKDRIFGATTGLLILATLYLIITTINPELKFLKLDKLDAIPPPPDPAQQAGVYIYNQKNCSPPVPESPHIINVPDLGLLTNRVNAVDIVQHPSEDLYYISILYDSPNFWGKCQYINPNSRCVSVDPFAASASVYRYNHSPQDGSITFYRKSFFNSKGGSYKIPGTATKHIYIEELKNLTFENVPKEEQKCVQWDKKGICIKKKPQDLSGENISSIKIDGNYLVLLIYFNKNKPNPDPDYGPWSFCQAFSTKDDINNNGPRQIKWENIRNLNSGNLPNYVLIFPVK